MRKNKPQVLFILCILLLLGIMGCAGNRQSDADITEDIPAVESSESNINAENSEIESIRNKISWNGKVYEYNDHLSNFLFIGVDKESLVESTMGSTDAGKADALFLLSWDRVIGDITVISIPRDTVTTMNVYDRDGTDLGPVEQHICLAYSYGDGKHESCRMTKEAVSRLFYRIPILGYCAVTLEALTEISAALGPVTVTVPNDSLVEKVPEMYKGAQITITEENIEMFVRARDTAVEHSALERQERQNAYLQASYEKLLQDMEADSDVIMDVYEKLTPYMVTSIGNDQFVKIMESVMRGNNLNTWTVPGEGVSTEVFDEFHVEEEAFYEQILESFFEEAK